MMLIIKRKFDKLQCKKKKEYSIEKKLVIIMCEEW